MDVVYAEITPTPTPFPFAITFFTPSSLFSLFFQDYSKQPDIRNVLYGEAWFFSGFLSGEFAFAVSWAIMRMPR